MIDQLVWHPDTINVLFAEKDGHDFFYFDLDEIYMCRTSDGKYGIGLTAKQALIAAERDMQRKS